jgi:hypothetical protein
MIPDDEPDLDWFNRPRHPSNPDPDGIDQRPTWQPPEVQLDDGRTLVPEYTGGRPWVKKQPLPKEILAKRF